MMSSSNQTSYADIVPLPLLGQNIYSQMISPDQINSYQPNLGNMPLVRQINKQIKSNSVMGHHTEQLLKFKDHPNIKVSKAAQKQSIRNNLAFLKNSAKHDYSLNPSINGDQSQVLMPKKNIAQQVLQLVNSRASSKVHLSSVKSTD